MTIGISILGATGKMGKRILHLALEDPQLRLIGASSQSSLNSTLSLQIEDVHVQLPLTSDPLIALQGCDVAIDFTFHEATKKHLHAALKAKKPLVIGTTGHSQEEIEEIAEASRSIPILYSPNFSFAVALCLDAVSRFGKALFGICDIDIVETHHVHKKDMPSGTSFAFAKAIGQGKIAKQNSLAIPRKKEEIAIHSIRSGKVIGEHIVIFECGHERIELKHTAHSRDAFAKGALMGAKFLVRQAPGLYSLKDLFELN
jgi:4-hydroxy-tetrahydrodipicolinate reductase